MADQQLLIDARDKIDQYLAQLNPPPPPTTGPLKFAAAGCFHVQKDLDQLSRETITEWWADVASRQPHLVVGLGDWFETKPTAAEGVAIAQQLSNMPSPEIVYPLMGNHDSEKYGDSQQQGGNGRETFDSYLDPFCTSPSTSGRNWANQPFPIEPGGTSERYAVRVGNVLMLFLSDKNWTQKPKGRGNSNNGYPAGCISGETRTWLLDAIGNSPSTELVFVFAHHMLRETTLATGDDEGVTLGYHGNFSDGYPTGASYLSFIGNNVSTEIQDYLAANPGSVDAWIGCHTHAPPGEVVNGRSHIETKWGTVHCNAAGASVTKGSGMSRFVEIDGDQMTIDCYLHTDDVAPRGLYLPEQRVLTLAKPFSWS